MLFPHILLIGYRLRSGWGKTEQSTSTYFALSGLFFSYMLWRWWPRHPGGCSQLFWWIHLRRLRGWGNTTIAHMFLLTTKNYDLIFLPRCRMEGLGHPFCNQFTRIPKNARADTLGIPLFLKSTRLCSHGSNPGGTCRAMLCLVILREGSSLSYKLWNDLESPDAIASTFIHFAKQTLV
jgi:hypothetical protein